LQKVASLLKANFSDVHHPSTSGNLVRLSL